MWLSNMAIPERPFLWFAGAICFSCSGAQYAYGSLKHIVLQDQVQKEKKPLSLEDMRNTYPLSLILIFCKSKQKPRNNWLW